MNTVHKAKQPHAKQQPAKQPLETQSPVVKKAPAKHAPATQDKDEEKNISFKDFLKCLGIIHYGDTSQYASIAISWEYVITHINKKHIFKNANEFYIYLQYKIDSVENIHKWHYMYILQEINKYQDMSEQFHKDSDKLIYDLRSYILIHKCTNMEQLKSKLEYSLRKINIYDEKNKILYNVLSRRNWFVMSRYICDILEFVDEYNTQPYDLFNIEKMQSQKLAQKLA
jgi:hypothetical protein